MTMNGEFPTQEVSAGRWIAAVPWYTDGYHGLSVKASTDVPPIADQMIRRALVRGALAWRRLDGLDRALNRELWSLGYVARLEANGIGRGTVLVKIEAGR
jgi:hypothetical protein